MIAESLRVEFAGEEVPGLYDDLVSLEVELDDRLTGMFRLELALPLGPDGTWSHLDDARLAVWTPVEITAGVDGGTRRLISGYVTHVRPEFAPGLEDCTLRLWGMDAGVLLDRADRLRAWPGRSDADIAAEVFRSYGLTPRVTATGVVHDERLSTIVQRETDLRFLRRLALRNGFTCHVDGGTGHFGPPVLDGTPLPVLAVQFGAATNVERFSLEVDALAPVGVAMTQADRLTGEVLEAAGTPGRLAPLGARGAAGLLPAGLEPGLVRVGQTVATGAAEMTALCQGLLDQGEWFVTGEGEVSGNRYGAVLLPHATVPVKGVGETHSGLYEVTHVTHSFTADGYRQRFKVRRNGLMPTGREDFG